MSWAESLRKLAEPQDPLHALALLAAGLIAIRAAAACMDSHRLAESPRPLGFAVAACTVLELLSLYQMVEIFLRRA